MYSHRYLITWSFILLLFVLGGVWLALGNLRLGMLIRPLSDLPQPPPKVEKTKAQRIREERLRRVFGSMWDQPPKISVKGTSIIISSPDGKVSLELTTPEIESKGDSFEVGPAEVRVFDVEGMTVNLKTERAQFSVGSNLLTIEGSISGLIPAKGQSFIARRMVWRQSERYLLLEQVEVVDPAFSTRANTMRLDLRKGSLTLSGEVVLEF